MRVMVLVKATESSESESSSGPDQELLEAMGRYNEQLAEAGIMKGGEGLKPSSQGVRVRFSGEGRTVIEGPFAHPNELVAGFWIWEVGSMEEAIEWVKKAPNPMPEDSEIEIRPIYEMEDFDEMTPEMRDREKELRERL